MSKLMLLAALAATTAGFGFPVLSDVTITANDTARRVTVSYTLANGPAIVTAEILTNGVAIGAAKCATQYGDVNCLVPSNGVHSFTWLADHDGFNARLDNMQITARVRAWATDTPPDYLVVGLDGPNDVRYFTSTNALPGGLANEDYRVRYLVMRKIPAAGARSRLGCAIGETGAYVLDGKSVVADTRVRELPRMVTFTNDFWLGIYPVTQGQWKRIRPDNNPSTHGGYADSHLRPVEGVGWVPSNNGNVRPTTWPQDGHVLTVTVGSDYWILRLRYRTGVQFDLPTDAQWEFACRAGCVTALYDGTGLSNTEGFDANLDKLGWFLFNSGNITHPVGLKQPNAWGLYDMLGNVWEMVLDLAADGGVSISNEETVEPTGPASVSGTKMRCKRGGGHYSVARQCRCAMRGAEPEYYVNNGTGFRLMAPLGLTW